MGMSCRRRRRTPGRNDRGATRASGDTSAWEFFSHCRDLWRSVRSVAREPASRGHPTGIVAVGIVMNPKAGWQQVVVFEADSDAQSAVNAFIARFRPGDEHGVYRIEQASRSPAGFQWYDGYIDFSIGERRAIHLASRLVDELGRAELPLYRLVAGREWLDLAAAQKAPD